MAKSKEFQQFKFIECLSKRSLNALPAIFIINKNQNAEVLLLRLLTGSLDFENNINKLKISQRENYTLTDYIENSRISAKLIIDVFKLNGQNIKFSKVENYYKYCINRGNKIFFDNLLLEFCNYFYQTKRENHSTAFLHLYRATELISFCFPLHFASKSKSYKSTYNSLKEFFTKTDGELSFFKQFVNNHLFKGNSILDIDLDIHIKQSNSLLQEQYFNAIKKLCDKNNNITVKHTTPNSKISISRRGLTCLIMDLRNRYFHLLSGDFNDNFSSSELAEVDLFYKNVNKNIINWLSLIYIEILLNTIE